MASNDVITEEMVRSCVKKYSTERLKDELANTQLVIVGEQIEKLSRAQIVPHVTQIRFQS